MPTNVLKGPNSFFSFFWLPLIFLIFLKISIWFFFLLLIHLNEQYDPEARVYFIEKLKYNLRLQNDGEKWAKKFRSKNNLFTNLRNYL